MRVEVDDRSDTVTTVDSTPATKADLDALEKRLDARLDAKLSNYPTKQDLANELARFAREELAHAFNVALEQMRIFIGALDDKHMHHSEQLRSDLDAHRADTAVHRAPRSRKTGSR